jgi:hypothetical protein
MNDRYPEPGQPGPDTEFGLWTASAFFYRFRWTAIVFSDCPHDRESRCGRARVARRFAADIHDERLKKPPIPQGGVFTGRNLFADIPGLNRIIMMLDIPIMIAWLRENSTDGRTVFRRS